MKSRLATATSKLEVPPTHTHHHHHHLPLRFDFRLALRVPRFIHFTPFHATSRLDVLFFLWCFAPFFWCACYSPTHTHTSLHQTSEATVVAVREELDSTRRKLVSTESDIAVLSQTHQELALDHKSTSARARALEDCLRDLRPGESLPSVILTATPSRTRPSSPDVSRIGAADEMPTPTSNGALPLGASASFGCVVPGVVCVCGVWCGVCGVCVCMRA